MRPHEWLAILIMSGLLIITACSSHIFFSAASPSDELPPHYILDQEIEVVIQGAVENPGAYKMPRGATVKDLVAKASPLPNANLTRLKPESKLRAGQKIVIPLRKNKPLKKSQSQNQVTYEQSQQKIPQKFDFNSGI